MASNLLTGSAVKVLLVEDTPLLKKEIAAFLQSNDFTVDSVTTIADAEYYKSVSNYAAIVLDLNLPDGDGVDFLRAVRANHCDIPVLVLTARSGFEDLVEVFKTGADDYLTKPFRSAELLLRLRALIRRRQSGSQGPLTLGPLAYNPATQEFSLSGLPVRLTAFERKLLGYMLQTYPGTVTRAQLSEAVYGWDQDKDFNSIEVVISRLRRKVRPLVILTVRGEGYRLEDSGRA